LFADPLFRWAPGFKGGGYKYALPVCPNKMPKARPPNRAGHSFARPLPRRYQAKAQIFEKKGYSMADSPTEHFDHAEHAQHALHLGDPFLSKVSITIAILAVIAATVGSLETLETAAAIGDKNAAVLLQNRVTDNWNFYQAKSIKKHLYTLNAANGGPLAQDFKKQAEGYGAEEKELFAKGQALEHQTEEKLNESEHHEHRHHVLTVAVTFLHVAIAIATIAIIVRGQRWPWHAALVLGATGTIGAAYAYFI
jgi:Domain of unknown function (DUF4337)